MKSIFSAVRLIIVSLLFVGCTPTNETTLRDNEAVEQQPVVNQPMETSTALPTTSATPLRTASAPVEPTYTPSPTLSLPTATATPVALPTFDVAESMLSEEEATANLIELLATNKGCELPCWWGIVPGETRVDTIESIFVPLGFDWSRDYEELHSTTPQYYALLFLEIMDEFVQVIEVKGGATEETYDRNEAWRPYAIPRVLERLGSPEQVYVYYPFRFDPGGMQAYRLFMVYPDRGVEIDYLGKASLVDERPGWARACPDILETDAINLLLYAPGSVPDYLERSLPRSSIPVASGVEGDVYELISWEQATGGTLVEFVQLFTEHEEGAVCFDFQTYWTGRSD